MKAISPKVEALDIILLNGHVGKLPSKYLCFYPWIFDALNLGQRGLLFPWVMINAEIPDCPEC